MSEDSTYKHHIFSNVPGLADAFTEICVDEVNTRGYNGSSLRKLYWKRLRTELNAKFNVKLDQKALRNRWEHQKKKYDAWRKYFRLSGGGINMETGTINWTESKWDEVLKKYPDAKLVQKQPFPEHKVLAGIYESLLAMGEQSYATAATNLPQDQDPNHITVDVKNSGDGSHDIYWENMSVPTPSGSIESGNSINEKGGFSKMNATVNRPKKRRRNVCSPDTDVKELIGVLKSLVSKIHLDKEADMTMKESYSVPVCVDILKNLKEFERFSDQHYEKAIARIGANEDLRKTLVQLVSYEDKLSFVMGVINN